MDSASKKFKYHSLFKFCACISACLALNAQASDPKGGSSQWMLGDWNGKRTELLEQGVDVIANYAHEMAYNAKGGYSSDKTVKYANNIELGTQLDLEKLMGMNDASFRFVVSNRNGSDLTVERLVDPRTGQVGSTTEVAGRGQVWRLSQLWFEQSYFERALDWKIGRVSPNEDFQDFPCTFQNLSFCSSQAGVWVSRVWYGYPVSTWGTRLRYHMTPETFFQVGAFLNNERYTETDQGFNLSTKGSNGTNVPIEFVWKPKHGLMGLPGEYRVGAFHMNVEAPDISKDANGRPMAMSGLNAKNRSSRDGVWFIGRQQIAWFDDVSSRPLEVFAQAHLYDRDTSFVDRFYSAGIIATGIWSSRPTDQIGFAISNTHINDRLRDHQKMLNEQRGVTDYNDPSFTPVQRSQWDAEIFMA